MSNDPDRAEFRRTLARLKRRRAAIEKLPRSTESSAKMSKKGAAWRVKKKGAISGRNRIKP